MKSTAEKLERKATFVYPVSVISSIYTLDKDEQRFLDAATNNDLETIKAFVDQPPRHEEEGGEWRMYFLGDAALILAIQQNNRDAVKLLLSKGLIIREPHSRSCQCNECSSLGVLLKSLSRLNTYKAMSNPTYLSYCYLYGIPLPRELPADEPLSVLRSGSDYSPEIEKFRSKLDPIYRAFELNGKLERLASTEYEFKKEYRQLSNQCEEYAVDLLNLCHNMNEIASVMSMPRIEGENTVNGDTTDLSVLNFAIKNKNERFVAHPYSQLMLNSVLYQGLHGWQYRSVVTKSIVLVIFSILLPFWSLFYLIAPQNSLNVMLKTPLAKFISNVVSFLWFVGLLIIFSMEDTFGETIEEITITKLLMSIWVIGMIVEEVKESFRQGSQRYFSQWWNIVTVIMLALFVLAGLLWFIGYSVLNHESHAQAHYPHEEYFHGLFSDISKEWAFKFVLLSNTFYSLAFILSFVHISNALQVNATIGPLHLSLVQMCRDVLKFLLLFSILYFAFGFAIRKVYSQFVLISTSPFLNATSPAVHKFADVFSSFSDLFWALFDKTDLEAFKIGRPEFKITEVTGEMLFAVYNIAAILVALNMLIAMMANSFQKVADDADIQWKFSRTRMWMQYVDKGSVVPPPFTLIPNWKAIVSGIRWIYRKIKQKKPRFHANPDLELYEEIGSRDEEGVPPVDESDPRFHANPDLELYEEIGSRDEEGVPPVDESDRKTVILSLINRYFVRQAEQLNSNI